MAAFGKDPSVSAGDKVIPASRNLRQNLSLRQIKLSPSRSDGHRFQKSEVRGLTVNCPTWPPSPGQTPQPLGAAPGCGSRDRSPLIWLALNVATPLCVSPTGRGPALGAAPFGRGAAPACDSLGPTRPAAWLFWTSPRLCACP